MSPLLKTLSLVIVATALSAVASYFYPWVTTEEVSSAVGEPLFKDYEPTQVRRILIEAYNKDTNQVEKMQLRQKAGRWIMPDKDNFEVSNTQQITLVTNSLLQLEVLEEKSNDESDHRSFGVVDPALHETTPNKSALGIKITLEESSKPIASLIVGKPVDSQRNQDSTLKFYVSEPGKPNVYVLNVNPFALSTNFASWVDQNIFGITDQVEFSQFFNKANSADQTGSLGYIIEFDPTTLMGPDQKLSFTTLKKRTKDGTLVDGELANVKPITQMQPGVTPQSAIAKLAIMLRQSQQLFFTDVFSKPEAAAKALLNSNSDGNAFESLEKFGFTAKVNDSDAPSFEAAAGSMGVKYRDEGLVFTMYLGNVIPESENGSAQPSRYGMLIARVDESLIPVPNKPEDDKTGDEADQENRAYLLAVKERNDALSSARISAKEFNRRHAGWIYAVPEQVVKNVLPEFEFKADPATVPDSE